MNRPSLMARVPAAGVALASAAITAAVVAAVLAMEGPASFPIRAAIPLALLGAGVAVLALRYYAAGLPLLIALIYLNLSEALVRSFELPSLLQILVAGLVFAAWLNRDTERLRDVSAQPVTIAIALYLVVLIVSTAVAADPGRADSRIAELLKASVIFFLATALMRTRERAEHGINALIGAAALISAIVIAQALTGSFDQELGGLARVKNAQIYEDVFQPRIAGPIGDPNFFAQVLLIPFPVAAVLAWTAATHRRRLLCFSAAALIGVATLLTYSRGAMLAGGVMGLLLLGFLHISWKRTAVAITGALVLFLLLPDAVTRRIVTIEELLPAADAPIDPDSSIQERRLFMQAAWRMFADNPLLGVGAANYATRYDEYAAIAGSAARLYEDPSALHFPHNLLLEVAAESGIAGLAAFGLLMTVAFGGLLRARRAFGRTGERELQLVATGFLIAITGYLVTSLFLHLAFPRYLWLVFAFAATLDRLSQLPLAEASDA